MGIDFMKKMSGFSEKERVGFKKIFSSMTEGDLLSLSDTVTNKMIVVENVTGKTSVWREGSSYSIMSDLTYNLKTVINYGTITFT